MTVESKEQALKRSLEQAVNLLESVGEENWSPTLRQSLAAIDPDEILSWFGGMGSFNDVMICAVNGHRVEPKDESVMNARLQALRSRIYELATQLRA